MEKVIQFQARTTDNNPPPPPPAPSAAVRIIRLADAVARNTQRVLQAAA